MTQELDNKYFILKGEDIGKFLTKDEMFQLHDLSMKISGGRKSEGKQDNEYVVLNLEDPIDLGPTSPILETIKKIEKSHNIEFSKGYEKTPDYVKDIAWSVINAIKNKKNWTVVYGKT